MKSPSYGFDASTADGQKRLMAVSMGLDSEAYIDRALRPARVAEETAAILQSPNSEVSDSLAQKALYYWRWYLINPMIDNLTAAYAFMQDYRKLGGLGHSAEWKEICAKVESLSCANA